ncbi:(Fe-S)-binding protein [Clostridium estertheticum]|uniref:(Fe-S)-binding protein n=1 Tax=Clostridium estertheticum TaxID=238834 RepID=A0A5N7IY52_9CLOT|nr:(Fe-S)-binding protein [Clostridium estertheticum]MPQ30715.1 (Fe-S)-binding protein [Clostridium estertheticum]MPQ61391.1 (Fe-S)-binding protein [Clostridium estertheticum]
MKNLIKNEIEKFVLESKGNWFEEINDHFYDEPIIKFAAADDPLFEEYKKIIGNQHFTPKEIFELAFGEGSYNGGTVISVVLPINEKIRKSNRTQKKHGSREWSLARTFGDEVFITEFVKHLVKSLTEMGHRTISPYHSEWFKISVTESGPTSNWSERHIAYVAGLGTFSINDAFITEKGIAVKLISVVTELKVTPDIREAKKHTENCLLCSKGICGACIKRCPVNAISKEGHDKIKCYKHVYGDESRKLAESYGGSPKAGSGCGLCQTGVPCEGRNPIKIS